jgi:UvrD-like helicase family protein
MSRRPETVLDARGTVPPGASVWRRPGVERAASSGTRPSPRWTRASLPAVVTSSPSASLKQAVSLRNDLLFATVHRSKGLEFENVIVTSTTVGSGARGEVTPQLIYVSLTRARQRAVLLTVI